MMELSVMFTAERYREFIAYLHAEPSWLRKTEVMRVRRLPLTQKAGLRGHESKMGLIAIPPSSPEFQH